VSKLIQNTNWPIIFWWIIINIVPFGFFQPMYYQLLAESPYNEDAAALQLLVAFLIAVFFQSILLSCYDGPVKWRFLGLIIAIIVHIILVATIKDRIALALSNESEPWRMNSDIERLVYYSIAGVVFGGIQFILFFRSSSWGLIWWVTSAVAIIVTNMYFNGSISMYNHEWNNHLEQRTFILSEWIKMSIVYGAIYAIPTSIVLGNCCIKRPNAPHQPRR
jgi:hypothetical protein